MLQKNAQELIDGLEARSTRLGDALSTTLTLAKAHCLMDPRASIFPTWDAWVNAMQVGSAVFAAATTTEARVQYRIAHEDRDLQATGPQWYVHPNAWLTAFYLAVVCRERERITALCQVPLSLLRENGSRFDEFQFAWVDTLQTYWLGGPDLGQKLVAAVDGTNPETVIAPETVGKLMYPPMEMFHRIIRKDLAGFNRALVAALQWHKEYWTEEDRAATIPGLVALAPSPWPASPTTRASPSRSSPSTCPPSSSNATGAASSPCKQAAVSRGRSPGRLHDRRPSPAPGVRGRNCDIHDHYIPFHTIPVPPTTIAPTLRRTDAAERFGAPSSMTQLKPLPQVAA